MVAVGPSSPDAFLQHPAGKISVHPVTCSVGAPVGGAIEGAGVAGATVGACDGNVGDEVGAAVS